MRSDLAVFFFFLEQRLLLPIHCDLAWCILHNWRYYGRLLKFITQRARHASGEKKKCIFRWYSSNLCWLNGSVLHFCFFFLLSELLAPFMRSVPFGRIQNMDPRSMDHPCGPGPWTPSWTTPLFKRQRTRPKVSERIFKFPKFWICGPWRYRFKMYLFLKCRYLWSRFA